MAQSYAFETDAAIKALLHACKHPSTTVTGVFVGTAPNTAGTVGSEAEKSSASNVTISDYIPLFHTQTSIGPCCESALRQVQLFNFIEPVTCCTLLSSGPIHVCTFRL